MARREKGSGCITQRPDGTWTGRLTIGYNSDGKQKIKAVYGKTQKEVRQKLKEIQEDIIKFGEYNINKITMGELIEEWQTSVKRQRLKATSYDRLECTITNQVLPHMSYLQITQITTRDVQLFINELTDKGYSYSTIKKAYNVVNSALRFAANRDYIRKNPCIDIVLPEQIKRETSDIVYFSDEEVEQIVNAATFRYKNGKYMYKYGPAMVILLNTGMRVGELLALKWKNVDFKEKQIHVVETRHLVKNRNIEADISYTDMDTSTKTKSSNRYIPINKKTEDALMYFKSITANNPYVLSAGNPNVIRYRNFARTLENIIERCGIDHGSLHSLRHTFATRLFRQGIDIKVISELLGHSDISITYDVYVHVIEDQKKKAVDVLNNL